MFVFTRFLLTRYLLNCVHISQQQNLNPPINAPGHTSITSPVLPLVPNFSPSFLCLISLTILPLILLQSCSQYRS